MEKSMERSFFFLEVMIKEQDPATHKTFRRLRHHCFHAPSVFTNAQGYNFLFSLLAFHRCDIGKKQAVLKGEKQIIPLWGPRTMFLWQPGRQRRVTESEGSFELRGSALNPRLWLPVALWSGDGVVKSLMPRTAKVTAACRMKRPLCFPRIVSVFLQSSWMQVCWGLIGANARGRNSGGNLGRVRTACASLSTERNRA